MAAFMNTPSFFKGFIILRRNRKNTADARRSGQYARFFAMPQEKNQKNRRKEQLN
jgi:hypothetical protein